MTNPYRAEAHFTDGAVRRWPRELRPLHEWDGGGIVTLLTGTPGCGPDGCRYGLSLLPMTDWTAHELYTRLSEDEGEYQRWNTARRIRDELARRGLHMPPEKGGSR